jgi:GGDEF domain-containing protein
MHVNQDGVSLCRDRCPLKLIMENGENAEVEVYLHHVDGHRVPVNGRAASIYSAQGVTVSVGGACVQPDDSVESLLKRADTLLYKSKGKGRNQVSISGD